jgi:DNA topoisomerase III
MIVDYFFATLSEDAKINEVTTKYKIGYHEFQSTHHEICEEGYMKYFPLDERTKRMLKIQEKDILGSTKFEVVEYKLQKWQTAPPEYLSESELIELMKKNKIGTNGTIPDHIKRIQDQRYVKAVEVKDGEKIKR